MLQMFNFLIVTNDFFFANVGPAVSSPPLPDRVQLLGMDLKVALGLSPQ
jgi:hypothetical protein